MPQVATDLPAEVVERLDEFTERTRIPRKWVYATGIDFVIAASPVLRDRLLAAQPPEMAAMATTLEAALAAEDVQDAGGRTEQKPGGKPPKSASG